MGNVGPGRLNLVREKIEDSRTEVRKKSQAIE
jgi:hypothetical protein